MPPLDPQLIFQMALEPLKQLWPFFVGPIILAAVLRALEEFLSEKDGKYFLKRYRIDFLTLLFAIAGYAISYAFIAHPGLTFILSVFVTLIATMIIVYSKTSERDFYFVRLRGRRDKEDWIGDGTFQYERLHDAYSVSNSDSGFIFPKCLTWSDYFLEFDFKILKSSLGVILRGTNLSNLVMLQIVENGVRPHIRVNGFWKAWEAAEAKLEFKSPLNLDAWYHARLECDKGRIHILIYDEKEVLMFDRVWRIPSGQMTFSYQPPKEVGLITQSVISSIPFAINLEYGTVGFRNNGDETALVRDVLIEKL